MAIDAFMWFEDYHGTYLESESQVDLSKDPQKSVLHYPPNANIFEVDNFSFDLAQTLNIGSQAGGAGAGKVTFNPFTITRKTDKSSPLLMQMACSGTPFQSVCLVLRKSAGGAAAGVGFLKFTFKLVAVKTISWAHDAEAPKETVSFEYGGLVIEYSPQLPNGTLGPRVVDGWDRVKNVADTDPAAVIK